MSPSRSVTEAYEKARTVVFPTSAAAAAELAKEVKQIIERRNAQGEPAVLGLATGSTPVPFYRELIRLHREEGLSFKKVHTFNLDEYYGLPSDHPESYACFMADQLFNHIDIPKENIHIPSGTVPGAQVFAHCREYEEAIDLLGGIDLQILGIGRTGHIGFNEPGSSRDSLTRRITLDRITRQDAAADFRGEQNVPHFAITMGVGTILRARKLVLMAWGENKASIAAKAIEGQVTDAISASFLQDHVDARFFLDRGAASELTRFKLPWLVGPVSWTPRETQRAVCWQSARLSRPVLKLVDEDYNENGLSDLLSEQGPAYQLNIRIFNRLQNTVTGWPGGKPDADDTYRPERAQPFPKRVLIFSPEPQDALIAIGGTIDRLREQGHDLQVVAMTSGNLRVPDGAAENFASTLHQLATAGQWTEQTAYAGDLLKIIAEKGEFGEDPAILRKLKALILRGEIRDAAAAIGLSHEQIQFMDLPFYENGRYRRFKSTDADFQAVLNLIKDRKPHQVYLTGDAADPSSVPAITYNLIREALTQCAGEDWIGTCSRWLYRGKEKALEPHEIDMSVPLSPAQMSRKEQAVARLQNLSTLERNTPAAIRETAKLYDGLGLAEYEAMEAFQRGQRTS